MHILIHMNGLQCITMTIFRETKTHKKASHMLPLSHPSPFPPFLDLLRNSPYLHPACLTFITFNLSLFYWLFCGFNTTCGRKRLVRSEWPPLFWPTRPFFEVDAPFVFGGGSSEGRGTRNDGRSHVSGGGCFCQCLIWRVAGEGHWQSVFVESWSLLGTTKRKRVMQGSGMWGWWSDSSS